MRTLSGAPTRKEIFLWLKNLQKRATKMIPGLSNLKYEERLRTLQLPTLSYRRVRGDMIEVYKLLNNKYYYNEKELLTLNERSTARGNSKKLYKSRPRLDIKKYSFSHRVVDIWNPLPECVINAQTLFTFEVRLDKHWKSQDIVYDVQAKITTGREAEKPELVSEDESLLPEFNLEQTQLFDVTRMGHTQYGIVLDTFIHRSMLECTKECAKSEQCRSVMFEAGINTCTTNRWALRNESASECNTLNCSSPSQVIYAEKHIKTTMRLSCRDDLDCIDPMSECRSDACLCKPGYSYDKNGYHCVSECIEYGDTFQPDHDKRLFHNNNDQIPYVSLSVCFSYCINATSYVCKSVEYKSAHCNLSNVTAADRPELYENYYSWTLYTRDCQ